MLDSPDENFVDGALSALAKICEARHLAPSNPLRHRRAAAPSRHRRHIAPSSAGVLRRSPRRWSHAPTRPAHPRSPALARARLLPRPCSPARLTCRLLETLSRRQDSPEKLANDDQQQPLTFLVPKFLTFFGAQRPHLRRMAVSCVNNFLMLMPLALQQHMDQYLQGLFALATDPNPDVRCAVCRCAPAILRTTTPRRRRPPLLPTVASNRCQPPPRATCRVCRTAHRHVPCLHVVCTGRW
jgi:hypothetical protein